MAHKTVGLPEHFIADLDDHRGPLSRRAMLEVAWRHYKETELKEQPT